MPRRKVTIEFDLMELGQLEAALVKYHNSILDKRRKLRPSERAVWLAEVKRILEKVRAASVDSSDAQAGDFDKDTRHHGKD